MPKLKEGHFERLNYGWWIWMPKLKEMWCEVTKTKWPLHWGNLGWSNLNLIWGKCGVWLVSWWIPSPCGFLCLSVHSTLRVWCDDFLWFIAISIWDIDMLMILIDFLDCLSILILILPWLSYSLWHVCTHCCISCFLSDWLICLYIILIIFEHVILVTFILIVMFSFGLCVDMDDILGFCLIVCCMTSRLLCDCMLPIRVGRTSILLPLILWFQSFPSFWFLHLQVWGFVCTCSSDRASG